MNTTYDELYSYFIRNTKLNELDLPSTIEGQVALIHDGKIEYNIRLRMNSASLECDDTLEALNEQLNDANKVFICECMKLGVLKNMVTDFVSTWETFQNDIGRKYYKDQLNGRQKLVEDQEKRLDSLKLAIFDEYLEV